MLPFPKSCRMVNRSGLGVLEAESLFRPSRSTVETSQTCPNCGAHTGKKELSQRVHHCDECGYMTLTHLA